MAKGLDTMLRLGEWDVEQKRLALGIILGEIDALHKQQEELEKEVEVEQEAASSSPSEGGFFYGTYANNVIERRKDLANQVGLKELAAEQSREDLNESYRNLKKYEVAKDIRDKKEKAEQERKGKSVV